MVYRGKNIFTLFLEKNGKFFGINFLECFVLVDHGVIGKIINNIDKSHLGMKEIFLCQKLQLNMEDYHSYRIQAIDKNGSECILNGSCQDVIISPNIHLYNPISEDKY